MDGTRTKRSERRGSCRIELRRTVTIADEEGPAEEGCVLRNVSLTGALLLSGKQRSPGEKIHLVLPLSRRGPVDTPARVVRCTPRRVDLYAVAVKLDHPAPAAVSAIARLLERRMARQVRARRGLVLIIDRSSSRRAAVSRRLSTLGYPSVRTGCPVEAIWWLSRASSVIHTVIVGNPYGSANAAELARHLMDEFSAVRVVLLADATGMEEAAVGEIEVLSEPLSRDALDAAMRERVVH